MLLNSSVPASEVYFSPRDDVRSQIMSRIDAAKATIDIAVFAFTSKRIAERLVAARKRGVNIRMIRGRKMLPEERERVDFLQQGGIGSRVLPSVGLMHHKFAIIDGKEVITGSYNWTESAELENFENTLFLDDPKLVSAYQGEFQKMWLICESAKSTISTK